MCQSAVCSVARSWFNRHRRGANCPFLCPRQNHSGTSDPGPVGTQRHAPRSEPIKFGPVVRGTSVKAKISFFETRQNETQSVKRRANCFLTQDNDITETCFPRMITGPEAVHNGASIAPSLCIVAGVPSRYELAKFVMFCGMRR